MTAFFLIHVYINIKHTHVLVDMLVHEHANISANLKSELVQKLHYHCGIGLLILILMQVSIYPAVKAPIELSMQVDSVVFLSLEFEFYSVKYLNS